MSAKVRLGFIGAGWWATTNHMPILKRRDDVDFVGVASLGNDALATLKQEFGFQVATEDVEELLAQHLDAVVISSPHDLHVRHALQALNAGCHVLVEKPFALNPTDAWRTVNAAKDRGLHLLVPYGWNYMPFLEEAKAILAGDSPAGDSLGGVEYVLCHMASPNRGLFAGGGSSFAGWEPSVAESDLSTWQDPARGGGYAHGQLTHAVALLFMLTDLRVREVRAALLSTAGANVDLYDSASVVFDNGAIGTFSGAAALPDNDPFQVDLRMFGPKGALMVDTERERVVLRRHDGSHRSIDIAAGAGVYHCDEPPNRFIEIIKGNGVNNSDGDVAGRTVELIHGMHAAYAAGGPFVVGSGAVQ